jgi:post-segregation antitoxin (ccd killing protein)
MEQIARVERAERVPIGAFVDREQRDELVRLARERDCSMSRIVRRALATELERLYDQHVSDDGSRQGQLRADADLAERDGTSKGRREAVEPNASRGERPER